jgi:hypothetical protein
MVKIDSPGRLVIRRDSVEALSAAAGTCRRSTSA